MRSLEEPDAPRGRRLLWIVLGVAMLGGLVAWYATRTAPPDTPATTTAGAARTDVPISGNEPSAATERSVPGEGPRGAPPAGTPRRGDRPPARPAPAAPAPPVREFRVTSDMPGAYVFLDRKFLGTTPFVSRDIAPGRYQLNVQVEGRPPAVQTVEVLADTPTTVDVTLPPASRTAEARASVDAVAVVHQHGVGSCQGTLRATADGFRYETAHKDAFSLPFSSVETFTVDYAEKRLRLKQRGGRTWNFTTSAANGDPLFVFHRDVEAARR